MSRKFNFEAEIYESLKFLPLGARRKPDAVGIKNRLAQCEQLGRGESLMICNAPADSYEEQSAQRTFVEEVALARAGAPARILPGDTRGSANPPNHPPQVLAEHARVSGVELDEKAWAVLDDDQRYTLIKLGNSENPSRNLGLARQRVLRNRLAGVGIMTRSCGLAVPLRRLSRR